VLSKIYDIVNLCDSRFVVTENVFTTDLGAYLDLHDKTRVGLHYC
jgi:hypothetical protein